MIIVDTREKKWEHIKKYFDQNGIEYEVHKLDTCDYLNTDCPGIVVDRKASLDEVGNNLMTGKNNYHRFVRECRRARDEKLKMIVLVEGTNCQNVVDVKQWSSKYSRINGVWLAKEMFRLTMAYGIEWKLCKKSQTAKTILELLRYDK